MIQGRRVADSSAVGSFLGGPEYRPECNGNVRETSYCGDFCEYNVSLLQTAATHISSTNKVIVNLLWIAPPSGTGTIRFRFVAALSIAYNYMNYNLVIEAIHVATIMQQIASS